MTRTPSFVRVRCWRLCLLLLGALFALSSADSAEGEDETVLDVIELKAADARALAGAMGGQAIEDSMAAMARGASRKRQGHLLGIVGGPPMVDGPDGLSALLPDGLAAPPVALVERNALLVKGTPQAIDELRELIRALDKPADHVRINVDVFSSPTEFDTQRALQWRAIVGGMVGASGGGPPTGRGGLELYLGLGDVGLAFESSIAQTATTKHEGMMVVTQSGSPATIGVRTNRFTPIPRMVYDKFGFASRVYDLIETEIMTGLYVLPRVNAAGTVTMHIVPILDRPVGEVMTPGGGSIPVIESLSESTLVTIADGQTVAIGGLTTAENSIHTQFGVFENEMDAWNAGRTVRRNEITIFVTPTILPAETFLAPDPLL